MSVMMFLRLCLFTFMLSLPSCVLGRDIASRHHAYDGNLIRSEVPPASSGDNDVESKAVTKHVADSLEDAGETTTAQPGEKTEETPQMKEGGITTVPPTDTHPHLLNTQPPEEDASKAKGPFHPDEPAADPTYSDQKVAPKEKKAKATGPVSATQPPPEEYLAYVPSGKQSGGTSSILFGFFLGVVFMGLARVGYMITKAPPNEDEEKQATIGEDEGAASPGAGAGGSLSCAPEAAGQPLSS